MSNYEPVRKALSEGVDPALLCTTCPWDRNCFSPPTMTKAEIDRYLDEARQRDERDVAAARAAGRAPGLPAGVLMTALAFAGKDTSAHVCPVFALRLRSSGGRKIADTFKALMQDWDDQK